MRAHEFIYESILLLENRLEFLKKQIPNIEEKLANGAMTITPDIQPAIEASEGDTLAEQVLNWIIHLDPTVKKEYSQWLLNLVTRKKTKPEPLSNLIGIPEILTQYEDIKQELPKEQRNITAFKTIDQLLEVIRQHLKNIEEAQKKEYDKVIEESDMFVMTDQWIVVRPLTEFAAQFWGRESDWCTAWGHPKGKHPTRECHFDKYDTTFFYTLLDLENTENSIQISLGRDLEINNAANEAIDYDDFYKKLNGDQKVLNFILQQYVSFFLTVHGYDEELLLTIVVEHIKKFFKEPLNWIDPMFEDIEKLLIEDAIHAFTYARELNMSWAEVNSNLADDAYEIMSTNGRVSVAYASYVGSPWEEISPEFSHIADSNIIDNDDALNYALDIKLPWREINPDLKDIAEETIVNRILGTKYLYDRAIEYAMLYGEPWSKFNSQVSDKIEKMLAQDGRLAEEYAEKLGMSWEEINPELASLAKRSIDDQEEFVEVN